MLEVTLIPFQALLSFLLTQTGGLLAFSIAALVFLVRIPLIPLHISFFVTQQRMQKVQDTIKDLQKKYKNDRQKLSAEIMAVYKEHNIKMSTIFLFLFIQIPLYILLFFAISDWQSIMTEDVMQTLFSVDLAEKGSYLLVAIVTATQFLLLKVSQTNNKNVQAQKMQKYLLYFLVPLVAIFSFFLGNIISWYIIAMNCFSILQEIFILRRVRKAQSP